MNANGYKLFPVIASIIAIIVAVSSVAFSYGVLSARMDSLEDQLTELKPILVNIQAMDKNLSMITVMMQAREVRFIRIESDIDSLGKKIDERSRR